MNRRILYVGLGLLTLFLILVYPLLGSFTLSLQDLWEGGKEARIVFNLRLPRLILLLITGGSLALIGGTYQVLFRNSLAEPYVLGISSAVTLGLVITQTLLKVPPQSGFAAAIGLALSLGIALLMVFLSPLWSGNSNRLVLFGMGLNFLFSSLVFVLLSFHFQSMGQGSMRWLFGQIPWASWKEVGFIASVGLPMNLALVALSRPLDAFSLGDRVAKTLGYSTNIIRAELILLTSLLLGLLVPFTGAIGFVGLIIPHTVRLCFKPGSNRLMMSLAFVAGGAFLLLSDLISRMVLPPFEFPIGIITTLVGAPGFLYILWRSNPS